MPAILHKEYFRRPDSTNPLLPVGKSGGHWATPELEWLQVRLFLEEENRWKPIPKNDDERKIFGILAADLQRTWTDILEQPPGLIQLPAADLFEHLAEAGRQLFLAGSPNLPKFPTSSPQFDKDLASSQQEIQCSPSPGLLPDPRHTPQRSPLNYEEVHELLDAQASGFKENLQFQPRSSPPKYDNDQDADSLKRSREELTVSSLESTPTKPPQRKQRQDSPTSLVENDKSTGKTEKSNSQVFTRHTQPSPTASSVIYASQNPSKMTHNLVHGSSDPFFDFSSSYMGSDCTYVPTSSQNTPPVSALGGEDKREDYIDDLVKSFFKYIRTTLVPYGKKFEIFLQTGKSIWWGTEEIKSRGDVLMLCTSNDILIIAENKRLNHKRTDDQLLGQQVSHLLALAFDYDSRVPRGKKPPKYYRVYILSWHHLTVRVMWSNITNDYIEWLKNQDVDDSPRKLYVYQSEPYDMKDSAERAVLAQRIITIYRDL